VVNGLRDMAANMRPALSLEQFARSIDTIVHGTTVTTNATLTGTGAKSALLTTQGVRDALEMRRGIREEQYNNRYTNVAPLVPRYLRVGVAGRIDRNGQEAQALDLDEVRQAIELFRREGVLAVSSRPQRNWCGANCPAPTCRCRAMCCPRSVFTSASAPPR
jgi:N-methylhydantoinase A